MPAAAWWHRGAQADCRRARNVPRERHRKLPAIIGDADIAAIDDVGFRIFGNGGEHLLEVVGGEPIVRIQEHHPLGTGMQQAGIPSARYTRLRLPHIANARIALPPRADECGCRISRSVVDNDRLPLSDVLDDQALQRFGQGVGGVVRGNNDRDEWCVIRTTADLVDPTLGFPDGKRYVAATKVSPAVAH